MSEPDLNPVSVTQGDRVLTGVGVDPAQLEATMERHAPDEPAAPQATPEQTGANRTEPEKPQVTRGQKRFAELTSERDKALNAKAEAEREREELRRQLDDVRRPRQEPAASERSIQPPDQRLAAQAEATRPKPTEDEVGAKYQTYGDYVEDLADWKAQQRLSAMDFDARVRAGIEAHTASRTFDDHVAQVATRGRAAFADFDAVRLEGPGATINLGPDLATANARIREILRQPNAEHLMYAIAKDAQLATRLSQMSDVAFGMELVRLAPSVSDAPLASSARTGPVTAPPPPFQPVGAGSKTTVPPLADLPKAAGHDFDRSGYRERRAAELGRGVTRRR